MRERVLLPFARHVCSAERVRVSGCSYHLAGMCAVLSVCACGGVQVCVNGCSYHLAGMCAVLSGCA